MKRSSAMALLWALACGGGGAEPIAPTAPPPRGVPRVASTDRPPAKPPAAQPAAEPFRWLEETKASTIDTPPEATSPDAGKRDYGAELRAALGDPSSCLTARTGPDIPREINIDVEAYVMATGNISRSYVRSPQLVADELDCIRRRVEPLRLRPPIDDAPRSVRATLTLALETPAKTGT
jgi:hypothetical protein